MMQSEFKEARKDDDGKVELDLIPYESLKEIAKVLMYGKDRYGAFNWQNGLDKRRIVNALLRHSHAYANGETKDSDTGLSHVAHAACNAIFLLWYEAQEAKEGPEALTVRELVERIVDARD